MASALTMKRPHISYAGKFNAASGSSGAPSAVAVADVELDQAMKAPQFYLLGATFFCLASGGMSLMSVGMLQHFFFFFFYSFHSSHNAIADNHKKRSLLIIYY